DEKWDRCKPLWDSSDATHPGCDCCSWRCEHYNCNLPRIWPTTLVCGRLSEYSLNDEAKRDRRDGQRYCQTPVALKPMSEAKYASSRSHEHGRATERIVRIARLGPARVLDFLVSA